MEIRKYHYFFRKYVRFGDRVMKRLLLPVCLILIAVVLFSGVGEKQTTPIEDLTVSEAAFSIRSSGSEDATSFLVGRFLSNQGTRLNFDGSGAVEKTAANLNVEPGKYRLTQSADGAVVLQITFDEVQSMYCYRLSSPEGEFELTDSSGNIETFHPIL